MHEEIIFLNSLHHFLGLAPMTHFMQVSPFSPRNFQGSQLAISNNMLMVGVHCWLEDAQNSNENAHTSQTYF